MRQIFFFLCLALVGCGRIEKNSTPQKTLLLVSLPPYKTLVQQIAGDEFEVVSVVPVNADPHTYEPTSRQLTQVARGEVWFRIGEPFENKLIPLLKETELVDLRHGVAMIEEGHTCCHHDHQDRHIWLSPKLLEAQSEAITAVLNKKFGERGFSERLTTVKHELQVLDRDIARKIDNGGTFVVSHPAFAYFCRDYNCQQLSIEHEGKEPRPQELEKLLKVAKTAQIAIALPQHNNKGAQLIASKLHIPVRMVDPYAEDYSTTMRKLAAMIQNPYQTEYE